MTAYARIYIPETVDENIKEVYHLREIEYNEFYRELIEDIQSIPTSTSKKKAYEQLAREYSHRLRCKNIRDIDDAFVKFVETGYEASPFDLLRYLNTNKVNRKNFNVLREYIATSYAEFAKYNRYESDLWGPYAKLGLEACVKIYNFYKILLRDAKIYDKTLK